MSRRRATVAVKAQQKQDSAGSRRVRDDPEERSRLRVMEDELRDPKNFVEYFLPRPLRLAFFLGSAVSCLIASLLSAFRVAEDPSAAFVAGSGATTNLVVNLIGLATFTGLYFWDEKQADARIERRQQVRERQIAIGDREVYFNDQGEKMSKLKEVDDEWILRRLERWGKRDGMPFVGPKKGRILQQLVRDRAPKTAVEVGSMAAYSAILIAQAMPQGGKLVSIESDWKWVLVAKRFLGQATKDGQRAVGGRVAVRWGDARTLLAEGPSKLLGSGEAKIELLFLDGLPKEYLEYLQAAEPYLAPGALVIADNAGIFAQGGLKPYLEYVRSSPRYSSRYVESTLEWRDDVADGMEVSEYLDPQATVAAVAGRAAEGGN